MWNPFGWMGKSKKQRAVERLAAGILRSTEASPRAHDHFNNGNFDVSNDLLVTEAERSRLRSWCKKEYLDNPHARHIARSFALATYGTGPTLQITTDDEALNTEIEKMFAEWSEAVGLNWMWYIALNSLFYDGEAFFHFCHNPDVPGEWGVELIEARRIAEPFSAGMSENRLEGIVYNDWNKPVLYYVEKEYANPYFGAGRDFAPVPSERMLHFFLDDVVNQKRGMPMLQASLETLASLQRISRASLNAWELAAALNVILESQVEAADLLPCMPSGVDESEGGTLPAFQSIHIPKDGGGLLLPTGVRPYQMKNEHPTSQFADNKNTYIIEAGLCAGEPRNISTGDSSSYNYSSAQLDNEIFGRWGGTVQAKIGTALNRMLLVSTASQVDERPAASAFFGKLRGKHVPATWYFPRMMEGLDRIKDASSDIALVTAGLQTIREYCQRHGKDYNAFMQQILKERAILQGNAT